MEKVYSQYDMGGLLKTLDGMKMLANEFKDNDLLDILDKNFIVKEKSYSSSLGHKNYAMEKFNLDEIKNSITNLIPKYKSMKENGNFETRLYSSVQLLKINKILGN